MDETHNQGLKGAHSSDEDAQTDEHACSWVQGLRECLLIDVDVVILAIEALDKKALPEGREEQI